MHGGENIKEDKQTKERNYFSPCSEGRQQSTTKGKKIKARKKRVRRVIALSGSATMDKTPFLQRRSAGTTGHIADKAYQAICLIWNKSIGQSKPSQQWPPGISRADVRLTSHHRTFDVRDTGLVAQQSIVYICCSAKIVRHPPIDRVRKTNCLVTQDARIPVERAVLKNLPIWSC